MATSFGQPGNNISTTLGSPYTAGAGSLVLNSGYGASLPALTAGWFYRVTVLNAGRAYVPNVTGSDFTIFKATGLSTDTLTGVTVIEGTSDRNYPTGSIVEIRETAGSFSEAYTAINNLETGTTNAFDFMSSLSAAPVSITGTANLIAGRMNVCSGQVAYDVGLPTPVAGQIVGLRMAPYGASPGQLNKIITLWPGTGTIDGAANRRMWAGEFAVLYTDGTNWFKLFGRSIPMFCAMYRTSNLSVPDVTETVVPLDGTTSDPTGQMADAIINNRINIVRPSSYQCVVTLTWLSAAVSSVYAAYIHKTGATIGQVSALVTFVDFPVLQVSAVNNCTTTDYFQPAAFQKTGSNQLVIGGSTNTYIQVLELPAW
jgi:hypothetical protein